MHNYIRVFFLTPNLLEHGSEIPTCWMEHLEFEFEAHIWWFCSTREYYKTTKYELRTPTLSAPSSMHISRRRLISGSQNQGFFVVKKNTLIYK